MMRAHRPWLRTTELLGGPLLWAGQFTIVYGAVSVACARGWRGGALLGVPAVPALVVATSALAFAGTAALLGATLSRERTGGLDRAGRFLTRSTILLSVLSLVAIAYSAVPALLVPSCG